jgi:hypothetical protein
MKGALVRRIVMLLNEKNHYLEKFYALNETELKAFIQGRFETLESFYLTREKILEVIRYIDDQINELRLMSETTMATLEPSLKQAMRAALGIKDQYVSKIMEQDLSVISCIESAKSEIIRELQGIRKNKKAVAGYKSPTFRQRLDEEA